MCSYWKALIQVISILVLGKSTLAILHVFDLAGAQIDQPITKLQYVNCLPSQMKQYLRHIPKLNRTRNLPTTFMSQ